MRAINTQVCILGSGPAGATASLYLSRYGIDHVIVDRGTFPRDKVCGELFDGRVERILTDLIPTARRELTARACLHETWRNDIHARSAHLPLHFSRKNLGKWIIPRTELDAYLAEKVRASKHTTVLHGQQVQSVLTEKDGVVIQGPKLQIRAELLLQACGAQSHFTPHDKDDLLLCARQYHRGLTGVDDRAVSFYFFRKPVLGCLMLSPLPTGKWLVEIGVTKKDFRKGKLSFGQILTAYLEQDRALRQRFARATPLEKMKGTFMPIDLAVRPCAFERRLLVGAAAFSAHPVTGMGVGNAMVMGQLAAATARECVRYADYSPVRTQAYAEAVRKRLRPVVRFNHLAYFLNRNMHWLERPFALALRSRFVNRIFHRTDAVDYVFQGPQRRLNRFLPSSLRR